VEWEWSGSGVGVEWEWSGSGVGVEWEWGGGSVAECSTTHKFLYLQFRNGFYDFLSRQFCGDNLEFYETVQFWKESPFGENKRTNAQLIYERVTSYPFSFFFISFICLQKLATNAYV
jgi:hypothetical protein